MTYGRQYQHAFKWKTTTIFVQMEDDLNILVNGRQPKTIKIKTIVVAPLWLT